MSPHNIMLVAAAVSFGLGAANVIAQVNFLCLGLLFGTISLLV